MQSSTVNKTLHIDLHKLMKILVIFFFFLGIVADMDGIAFCGIGWVCVGVGVCVSVSGFVMTYFWGQVCLFISTGAFQGAAK